MMEEVLRLLDSLKTHTVVVRPELDVTPLREVLGDRIEIITNRYIPKDKAYVIDRKFLEKIQEEAGFSFSFEPDYLGEYPGHRGVVRWNLDS